MIIDIRAGDSMADVLTQVRESAGSDLTIRIPDESSLLLTANEFRALSLTSEQEAVTTTIESADPLRRQLASLFSLNIGEPEDSGVDPGGSLPPVFQDTLPNEEEEERDLTASSETWPEVEEPEAELPIVVEDVEASRTWRRRILGLVGLVLIGLLALAAWWWFAASSTVQLTLERTSVKATLPFSIAADNGRTETGTLTVPGQSVSFDVSVSLSAPTSGVRTIGDEVASGELVLRNATIESVLIEEGAQFASFDGTTFEFADGVEVPAVAPDGSAGEATAKVRAVEAGTEGNLDIGLLSGQLENEVYFSNRNGPIAGGTDIEIAIVTEEDLVSLQTQAEETLLSLATTSPLEGELRVAPASLQASGQAFSFDRNPGEEAESVSIEAQVTYGGVAFPTAPLEPAGKQLLADQVPDGFVLLDGSITFEIPAAATSTDQLQTLVVPVSGEYVRAYSEEDLNQLADDLAGQPVTDAELNLGRLEGVSDFEITLEPDWLLDRMPQSSGNIDFEVE